MNKIMELNTTSSVNGGAPNNNVELHKTKKG